MGSYRYNQGFAQMGCDLSVCDQPAVGFARVSLKDHGLSGFRAQIHMALCHDHILIGVPVSRTDYEPDLEPVDWAREGDFRLVPR